MSFRLYCEDMEARTNPSGPDLLAATDPLIGAQSAPPGDGGVADPNAPLTAEQLAAAWDPLIVVDPTDSGF